MTENLRAIINAQRAQAVAEAFPQLVALELENARLRYLLYKSSKSFCENNCPSVWKTSESETQPHIPICHDIKKALSTPPPDPSSVMAVLQAAENVRIGWRKCHGEYPRDEMLTLVEKFEALPQLAALELEIALGALNVIKSVGENGNQTQAPSAALASEALAEIKKLGVVD